MGILYDVIIIGSGPAGMTAAIYCVRKGLKTLVIGQEIGGQVAKSGEVENYLGYWVERGIDLVEKFHHHIKEFTGLDHIHAEEVILISRLASNETKFEVKTKTGKSYVARSLIVASGRNPRHLGVPGEEEFTNKGVSYCEVCDAPLFKGKITAVVGGGNSALEAAESLSKVCPQVYIINMGEELGGDELLRRQVEARTNIEIIHQARTVEVFGKQFVEGLRYESLEDKSIKEIRTDGIFIEIGWEPSVAFDGLTDKNQRGEIKIDKLNRTSVSGVFAAGDVTNVPYNQIIVAAGEGAKAALSCYVYLSRQEG